MSQNSYADITLAKDTITTSRPSASSPLNAALLSTGTQATIFDNRSRFLASDSAKLIRANSTNVIDAGTIVDSQSSNLTTVFFGEQAGVAGQAAIDVLYVPVTAVHTLRFTIGTEIPDEGDLEITFPTLVAGDADNDASPSATTFQFNNLVPGGLETNPSNIEVFDDTGNITAAVSVTETEPTSGAGGILSIEFDSGPIAAGSVITVMLGCSSAADENTCSTEVPRIINPTKTETAGTEDSWRLSLETENAADSTLEATTVGIATIESVVVTATVDPTLSFTIAGINDATAVNTGNAGCSQDELTNTGINATATEVGLGILENTPGTNITVSNISAQILTVSTNAAGGYALTATSSSSLLNAASGFFVRASTTPLPFPADSTDFFGLHACGSDVQTSTGYVESSGAGGADCDTRISGSAATECNYAWPTANATTSTTPLAIASDAAGPIGTGTGETGDGVTSISYAAGTDAVVPPGEYRAIITYIATPSF